jgi:hypothetical protein
MRIDADVGIQHDLHAKEDCRFWTGGCCLLHSIKSSVNITKLLVNGCHVALPWTSDERIVPALYFDFITVRFEFPAAS